jgi:hypothetical protein
MGGGGSRGTQKFWNALTIILLVACFVSGVLVISLCWRPKIPSAPRPAEGGIYPLNHHAHCTYMNRSEYLLRGWILSLPARSLSARSHPVSCRPVQRIAPKAPLRSAPKLLIFTVPMLKARLVCSRSWTRMSPEEFGTFGVLWSPSRSEGKVFPKTNADLLIHNTMLIFLARINWTGNMKPSPIFIGVEFDNGSTNS